MEGHAASKRTCQNEQAHQLKGPATNKLLYGAQEEVDAITKGLGGHVGIGWKG